MPNFTKRAIQAAFVRLLNEKPLDKVTVKDIVESCGINRNTFYYHYQDIFALLQDVFESEIAAFNFDSLNAANWKDGFTKAIDFCLHNKKAIYHVFTSSSSQVLQKYLYKTFETYTKNYVLSQSQGLVIDSSDLDYVIVFYKHAFMGIVIEWLMTDMRVEPLQAIEHFGSIFDGSLRQILEKISK